MQLRQNLPAHNRRLGVPCSAMDDAVPDTQDSGAAIPGPQPAGKCIQRLAPVSDGRIQFLIGETCTRGILDRQSRRCPDALDLPTRFQTPILALWPPVYAELQTRWPGI